ncbi:MAG: LysR family transcriptional regulator [Rhodospirillaceae bacterium]|nr:LysR family transcriptional regulator [Rhodospirillaceae bacterium]|tara:strand:+ start:21032 stop:21934 length:903 start_codon:yes stop_codon:yes gene_type:complete
MKLIPTMKHLQYLVALAEYMHFGDAAGACNVTQSTLSTGIRDLEAVLGTPVAERTNRSVLLTPFGEQIVDMARGIIQSAEDMMDLASGTKAPLTGLVRLGVIPTIGPYLLPNALPKINDAYPKLELYLREDFTDRLLEELMAGRLDLLILALPYDMDGVESEILFEEDFVLACPAGHPLGKQIEIETDALTDEPLLLLEEAHCLRQHSLDACKLRDRHRGKGYEASSMNTLVQMVSMGLGLTLLPRMAVDAGVLHGLEIEIVPLSESSGRRQIGLVWRKTSARAEEFKLLGSMLSSNAAA